MKNIESLEGKVAFVTGAASGLGLAIAETLSTLGASVAIADVQDDAGASAASRIGGACRFVHCDVTREDEIEAALNDTARHFGGLDIVVNNAGGSGSFAKVDEIDTLAFDQTVALLLRSVVLGIRHAVPHLRARGGGTIINMSSAGGLTPGSTRALYATCKAAIVHYTKEAALQLAADTIRVNAIAPGLIATPHAATVQGVHIDEVRRRAAGAQPLRQAGQPEDVAEACAFLASDAARFISGIVLPVDGAASAGRYASS